MKQALTLVALSVLAHTANADFTFSPALEVGYVNQNAKSQTTDRINLESISIDPSLVVNYNSRHFDAQWIGRNQYLIRSGNGDSFEDSFPEYSYVGELDVIDNVLTINANGALNYRNIEPSSYLVSDRFLDPDLLSKNRNNNIRATVTLNRLPFVEFNGSVGFTDLDSEQQNFSQNNLDAETFSFNSRISQGSGFKNFVFNVDSSFETTDSTSDTQQTRGRATNFDSRTVDANVVYRLIGDFGLSARARLEANKYDGITGSNSSFSYDSYGLGVAYFLSPNRSISITANVSDEDDAESESFIGVDLAWAFSARSRISANYGRRFFGESGNLQFSYNTKSLRTRLQYSERLTTFSRLVSDIESQGLFVCDSDNIEIGECFQPSSLNPQLEPGQTFVEFSEQVVDITEEPILNKSTTASLGYSNGRLSTTVEFRYTNPEYLARQREQINYLTNWVINWDLGPRTDLRTQLSYSENYQQSAVERQDFEDTIIRVSSAVRYRVNQDLSTELELRVLDRDSNITGRVIRDRRVSFTLRYDF
ncbi:TIGR03016 family PEP-CTERM system-associated outer membrane protein [Alteromonas sp. ASW11-36]|uniref:TIGR03016 family PEP-CTERM system-associated outer membrane protein n=1 Tax=Alteromonas arenosi TaxID=3055817 RepID=A0ABT7STU1_9ALTE|nr:TIGR03016 family PEP-CTERM system-associated outer membrane protein [Alteromonas sp. ASW11-36]MDM7859618.1 TIGR03016 family PEP-CTERM system-associated outer membrane protein [Alteromonas sp. ASW11-36]